MVGQRTLGIRRWATTGAVVASIVVGALGGGGAVSAVETHTVEVGDTLESLAATHGVAVEDLAAANGLEPWDEVYEGQELVMPGDGSEGAAPADDSGPWAVIDGIPAYKQSRSLSCEYASVYIATAAFGDPIYEEDILWAIPQASNPHAGYRGDIDGPWGNTDDYGVYAEALVPILEGRGFAAEVSYGVDAGYLQSQLDAGRPTIVWISARGEPGFYDWDDEGNRFKLVPYMHVVVAYGYDEGGLYVSDPGPGNYTYYSWSWFLDAWSVLDGMALSVYPTWLE
jgi:LysM repeat protein